MTEAEKLARYIEQWANSGHKQVAAMLRSQEQEIIKLKKEIQSEQAYIAWSQEPTWDEIQAETRDNVLRASGY